MTLKSLQKLVFIGASGVMLGLAAGPSLAVDLTVHVKNLRSQDGMLMVALFNSSESFLKSDKQFGAQMVSASQHPSVVIFKNLPAGRYAVSAFHDENGNGKMDSNMLGIPSERYGFSNNAAGSMGPPNFEQAMLSLSETREITIDLR
ncbi:MAG: DUF2141 domain-containing protein [Pseudomonadota bacterium]